MLSKVFTENFLEAYGDCVPLVAYYRLLGPFAYYSVLVTTLYKRKKVDGKYKAAFTCLVHKSIKPPIPLSFISKLKLFI